MVCSGASELVINVDVRGSLSEAAERTDEARVAVALEAVLRCDEAISYNVSPETCIDALLFEVKYALFGGALRAHRANRETIKRGALWSGLHQSICISTEDALVRRRRV